MLLLIKINFTVKRVCLPVRWNDAIPLHDLLLTNGRLVAVASLRAVVGPATSLGHRFESAVVKDFGLVVRPTFEDPALDPVTAG